MSRVGTQLQGRCGPALVLYSFNRPIRGAVLAPRRPCITAGPTEQGGKLHFPAGARRRVPPAVPPACGAAVADFPGPLGEHMDPVGRWRGLPEGPTLKHLTEPSYGVPREQQNAALQELTRAHVESFNYAVREGLSQAVQVSAVPAGLWRRCGMREPRLLMALWWCFGAPQHLGGGAASVHLCLTQRDFGGARKWRVPPSTTHPKTRLNL